MKKYCIIKSRTTVYFVLERDGESSSFHSHLAHSLHKPTKVGRHACACRILLLNGLLRSDEMLDVVKQGYVNFALPLYVCAFCRTS